MRYESWRISYQSSEQAARAAYAEMQRLRAELEKEKEISKGWSDLARRYKLDAERAGVRYELRFPKQGARGG